MATVLALIISSLLLYFEVGVSLTWVHGLAAGTGGLIIVLVTLTNLLLVRPLQAAELKATPRVSELVKGDKMLRYLCASLVVIPIFAFAIAVGGVPESWLDSTAQFSLLLVLIALSLDLLGFFSSRFWNYFNPPAVVKMVVGRAQSDIAQGRDAELCDWIAMLSEMALMSLKRHGSSLAERAVSGIIALLQRFLEVHRRSLQTESTDAKVHQRTSYVLFYGFERLQVIYNHALQERLEPICSHIVTSLGKVALAAAYGDITKVGYPLHYIGSFSTAALNSGMPDVAIKANITLLESGKLILSDVDLSKVNIRDTFISLVSHLEELAKATYRQDKESDLGMLTQPLRDLKMALTSHALADRSDMKAVITAIDGVLADFENLRLVLNALPPIPEVEGVEEGLPEIPELAAEAKRRGLRPSPSPSP